MEKAREIINRVRKETDAEKEARFAKLRGARAKANKYGEKSYEDLWDNMTQEELDYYKQKHLETSPEQRYQKLKEAWYFHNLSWCMRHEDGYDGIGCNLGECVPECRFYPNEGRIEDKEVLSGYEKKR
jgi:hypothetical protein